ncbi:MAG: hypothetical protein ACO3CX_06385, partial [Ilumatobacteraceae bacterium]
MTTLDDRTIESASTGSSSTDLGSASKIASAGAVTGEGGQELRPRSEISQKALMREAGAVLRLSESAAAALSDVNTDAGEDQSMIINMGPQHPSTHGVLRLMLELQGE